MNARLMGVLGGVLGGWVLGGFVLILLAGGVVWGEPEHSEEARELPLRLGAENREKDYLAMEAWVFEEGLGEAPRRARAGEAAWVLTDRSDWSAPHQEAKQIWVDGFLARLEREAGDRWWAWAVAGEVLSDLSGSGVMVDGEFRRAGYRQDATHYSIERDRALARQAFLKAIRLVRVAVGAGEATVDDLAGIYLALAGEFEVRPVAEELARTDLEMVPEISDESPWLRWSWDPDKFLVDGRSSVLGPDDGWLLPILRKRFEAAESDRERAYWLQVEAGRISPVHRAEAKLDLALMWESLLGVEELASAGFLYLEGTESEFAPAAPGEFELHTLKDHETFVIGVNGPSRRVLPERCRYLAMLRELVADEQTPEEVRERAVGRLLEILANRNQLDAAEAVAKQVLEREGGSKDFRDDTSYFLADIGPDGMFNETSPFVLGEKVTVEFISREIPEQRFELWKLDMEKALETGGFPQLRNMEDLTFGHSGWVVGQEEGDKLGPYFKRVAVWEAPIRMKANHLQTVSRIEVPVTEVGNYVVVADLPGKRRVVPLQVARAIILAAMMQGEEDEYDHRVEQRNLFVIDAVSGEPVQGVEVETPDGRHVAVSDHLGFLPGLRRGGVMVVRRRGLAPELVKAPDDWARNWPMDEGEVRALFVTNQPLYRPGQRVDFAGWLKRPNWKNRSTSQFMEGSEVGVRVTDPVGVVIYEKEIELDEFGGFAGHFELGTDIVLGDCEARLTVSDLGRADIDDPFAEVPRTTKVWEDLGRRWFRDWTIKVGEFRKPDFRVAVEAETGGEEFAAIVRASYQSGEPAKGARVKGRLNGAPTRARFFPKREWDDLYEAGYHWGLPRAKWIEDWEQWGIWPEDYEDRDNNNFSYENTVTLMAEGVTDEEGRARLVFPKKLPMLGGYDYECDVRVGVQEFTGRSVGAEASFVYSDRDFEVFAKPEKWFYRAGETVRVELWTMDRNREPVAGEGVLRVETLGLAGDELVRTTVWEKRVVTGESGRQVVKFTPPGGGQYRCVFEGGGGERGLVLEVLGERKGRCHYEGVQIIPERVVCAAGEEVEVLITTEAEAAQVWVFEALPDGQRRTPRLIETKDHTALVRIPVLKVGAPEFSLHAATVLDGRLKKVERRILVPPVESRLAVTMAADPERGKPGEQAGVEIEVKDSAGEPAEASLAVTAFDRALEDLGGPLPTARDRIPEKFGSWGSIESSQDTRSWRDEVIIRLEQPGCFFERGHLVGDPRWQATARFERVGPYLWNGYHPPELPNSIGGRGGADMGIFPVTPATPVDPGRYARLSAHEAELTAAEKAGMAGVEMRKNFVDRAYWGAALRTDAEGSVKADFELPDNLTAWRVQSWAFGKEQTFGDGQIDIEVSKDLQIRPVLPQSAVVGDELVVGLMLQNRSENAHEFQITMEAEGVSVEGDARAVSLPAGEEGRTEWKACIEKAGLARFRFRARSVDGSLTDGADLPLPVAPRLVPVTVAARGEIGDGKREARLELEFDEAVGATEVQVRIEAHPALSALSVLPDLVGYPYGCTEQTLNRFLPTLIAWKAADDLGLDWEAMQSSFVRRDHSLGWVRGWSGSGVSEVRTDLSAEKVRGMIYRGLHRLDKQQSGQGSWGWFSADDPEGSVYLTALAVRGIARARELGFVLEHDPGARGANWLANWARERAEAISRQPAEAKPLDAFVLCVLAEAGEKGAPELKKALLGAANELGASEVIHLALALQPESEAAELKSLLAVARERMNAVKTEPSRGWRWWQDPVELRAWFLKLLVKVGADEEELRREIGELLGRRTDGIRWKSTRDSALCVEAIMDAAVLCGSFGLQDDEEIAMMVETAGAERAVTLGKKNMWAEVLGIPIDGGGIPGGKLPVVVRGNAKEAVFAAAAVSYESAAPGRMGTVSSGIRLERKYFRVTQGGKRSELKVGETLRVGELVEVELRMKSDRERSFVHLRDPIPAGLEPLVELSGYRGGSYRESRTGETHFFLSQLHRWNGTQGYHLRAVTRGSATALPARAECMYAPGVFGQSGRRVVVVE